MTSEWWNCKEARQRINAEQEKRAAEQIEEINRAYKAAKIPGAAPRHWLGKISRMNRLGCEMPKGLEHLSEASLDGDTRTFLLSAKQSAKDYFASEYAGIRAQTLRKTQKRYSTKNSAKASQSRGGINSGEARRRARKNNAISIVESYKNATSTAASVKPVARLVAEWYVKNFSSNQSLRAVTQMLQRANLAT